MGNKLTAVVYPSILLNVIVFAVIAIGLFQLMTGTAELRGAVSDPPKPVE